MNLEKFSQETLKYSFYLLFLLAPLIWLPINLELFEFNKMILVYLLTCVISTAWLVKSLYAGRFEIRKTPLDPALIIFLAANVLATIFSIDQTTSIFGYYGRFHGSLLSTISYLVLYWALVSNLNKKQIFYCLYFLLFAVLLIAIYGILQHPNPIFALYGEDQISLLGAIKTFLGQPTFETIRSLTSEITFHGIDYDFWATPVEQRVFATLGQPNWLAAFLGMNLFLFVSLLFVVRKFYLKIILTLAIILTYLSFTFTYSRGGSLGLIVGLVTFVALITIKPSNVKTKILSFLVSLRPKVAFSKIKLHLYWLAAILIAVFVINYFFGNAFERRGGVQTSAPAEISTTQTQLESGGTQTAKIRTIVWNGSLEIFKHYPLFGSGVETFGYSYYQFRPVEHNLTVEWDYLYNRAHNEYLNYLATTGAIGLLSYLFLIGVFEFIAVKTILTNSANRLVNIGLISGYNAYLAQNFFGFSVVAIALLFFLFPAFFLIINGKLNRTYTLSLKKWSQNKFYTRTSLAIITVVSIITIVQIFSAWIADVTYNAALSSNGYEQSIKQLRQTVTLAPYQTVFQAELAVNLAGYATAVEDEAKKKEAALEADRIVKDLVKKHQKNVALWQNKRAVDFYLSKINKEHYFELIKTGETLASLAPTDASIQYDLALIYSFAEKPKEAEVQLEKVLKLKPDYREAVVQLTSVYQANDKIDKAINLLEMWLKTHPADFENEELLKQLQTT